MENILKQIKDSITIPLSKLNVIVDEITYTLEGNYYFLRIILDSTTDVSLDLDTIVEATNIINPILDKLDLIEESYILDVLSKERG